MSEIPFHTTRMARVFFEHSVPELIRQLERVGDGLERLIELHESKPQAAEAATTEGERDGKDRSTEDPGHEEA